MEQITIVVRDGRKARSLLDLLRSLDFVSILTVEELGESAVESIDETSREQEFFAAAGIWKDRDVTTERLRAEAWPRQTP